MLEKTSIPLVFCLKRCVSVTCRYMQLTFMVNYCIIGTEPDGRSMLLWNILTAAGQQLKSNWAAIRSTRQQKVC